MIHCLNRHPISFLYLCQCLLYSWHSLTLGRHVWLPSCCCGDDGGDVSSCVQLVGSALLRSVVGAMPAAVGCLLHIFTAPLPGLGLAGSPHSLVSNLTLASCLDHIVGQECHYLLNLELHCGKAEWVYLNPPFQGPWRRYTQCYIEMLIRGCRPTDTVIDAGVGKDFSDMYF